MDFNKVYQDIFEQKMTDCVLTFKDPTESVTLHCHKLVLYISSEFFRNIFSLDQSQRKYELKVFDAKCAQNIILSFYGKTYEEKQDYDDWKKILETYKCRNYFLLDNDLSKLGDLTVPDYGFNLLLEALSPYYASNDRLLSATIKRNFPSDFNPENLSEDLRNTLAEDNILMIMTSKNGHIGMWDIERNKKFKNVTVERNTFLSQNGEYVILYDGYILKIWRTLDGKQICNYPLRGQYTYFSFEYPYITLCQTKDSHFIVEVLKINEGYVNVICTINRFGTYVNGVKIARNGKIIVTCEASREINLWNINGELIRSLPYSQNFINIVISPDNSFLVATNLFRSVVWDIESGILVREFGMPIDTNSFPISYDCRRVAIRRNNCISVWNTENDQLIDSSPYYADMLAISENGSLIASVMGKEIKIWSTFNMHLICTFFYEYSVDQMVFKTNYKLDS